MQFTKNQTWGVCKDCLMNVTENSEDKSFIPQGHQITW